MARPAHVPDALKQGPFHVTAAREVGVTHDRLRGRSYRRLFPRVWAWVGHTMTPADWRRAAALALPPDARLTGCTRLQQLGLDIGPAFPLHFVVARDHHLDLDGIMLHRTDRMPRSDDVGVSATAAFVAYCAEATVVDAVAAGDWLLREGRMTVPTLLELCRRDHWRLGVDDARWIAPLLDERSRSPQESRVRVIMRFAGLPDPEVNAPVGVDDRVTDWLWRRFRVAAEYEGGHHQSDRGQYLVDIDRYRTFRDLGLDYVQITRELYATPTSMVQAVHRRLVAGGYDGPPPAFGSVFRAAFAPVTRARLHLPGGAPGAELDVDSARHSPPGPGFRAPLTARG